MIDLPNTCDLLIIGGGITGAGIFHETTRMGLKAVLVEQHDFAWGTSSRSSKLIHGGLRYLKEGHLALTRDAVKERERLLREAPGLVTPIGFLLPIYRDHGPGRWTLEAGLSLYDLMAQKRRHHFLNQEELVALLPFVQRTELTGGYEFWDAQVDDARLVLRLISEGCRAGGTARNYIKVTSVDRDDQGHVCGVTLQESESRETHAIAAPLVFNATGCWADRLHPQHNHQKKHLRPLRGSHLIFPAHLLPVKQAVSFTHPQDDRAMFIIPWEGVVLVGTTDLDHHGDINQEPAVLPEEVDYLLEGVHSLFPSLGLSARQCIAAIAGLRPIISSGGNRAPSEESREHDIWVDRGLITIAGGKLTTFRRVTLDALKAAQPFLPDIKRPSPDGHGFQAAEAPPPPGGLETEVWQRLWGRYGAGAAQLVEEATPETLLSIPGTPALWAELPYGIKYEWVRHLSDLMLRRVRIGLLLAEGGRALMPRIEQVCRPVLEWDRRRWRQETKEYYAHWQRVHGLPGVAPEQGRWPTIWSRLKDGISGLWTKRK